MLFQIRYFAALRERLGAGETLNWSGADQPTLGQLRAQLMQQSPAHAEWLATGRAVRGAINQVMALEGDTVPAGAEVAFFPPVTGG